MTEAPATEKKVVKPDTTVLTKAPKPEPDRAVHTRVATRAGKEVIEIAGRKYLVQEINGMTIKRRIG